MTTSILRPLSLAETLASRKPAVRLEAFNLSRECASAALESLTGASLFTREVPVIGPVCDCPAFQPTARVWTEGELEAARFLANRSAQVIRPRKQSAFLARLAQRLN